MNNQFWAGVVAILISFGLSIKVLSDIWSNRLTEFRKICGAVAMFAFVYASIGISTYVECYLFFSFHIWRWIFISIAIAGLQVVIIYKFTKCKESYDEKLFELFEYDFEDDSKIIQMPEINQELESEKSSGAEIISFRRIK